MSISPKELDSMTDREMRDKVLVLDSSLKSMKYERIYYEHQYNKLFNYFNEKYPDLLTKFFEENNQ